MSIPRRKIELEPGQYADVLPLKREGFWGVPFVRVLDAQGAEIEHKLMSAAKDTYHIPYAFIPRTIEVTATWLGGHLYSEEGMRLERYTDPGVGSGWRISCGDFWHDKHWRNLVITIIVGDGPMRAPFSTEQSAMVVAVLHRELNQTEGLRLKEDFSWVSPGSGWLPAQSGKWVKAPWGTEILSDSGDHLIRLQGCHFLLSHIGDSGRAVISTPVGEGIWDVRDVGGSSQIEPTDEEIASKI